MKTAFAVWKAVFVFTLIVQAQSRWPAADLPTVDVRLRESPLSSDEKTRVAQALANREYSAAETIVVTAVDRNPKSGELLKLAAAIFMLDRNPTNAAIALKKAERIAPLSVSDRFLLSMAYVSMGKGEWARPEFERLSAEENGNPLFPYWLARLDYDARQYEKAVARLQAVTEQHPQFVRAWDNLGLSLEALGRLDEAVDAYKKAVSANAAQLEPSAWPPLNLGTLLTKLGRLEEATEQLRDAVRFDVRLSLAHYRLGMVLHDTHSDEDAIRELQEASKLDPSDPQPLYALGRIYQSQGNEAAANAAFSRFKELKKARSRS
jgi:tetratricopeptide (TPR) repeat protein